MRILGLGTHVDCGSALLEDGKVVAAVNDERLVREKMVFGIPRRSIESVLEVAGISPEDIDLVAIATVNQHLVPDYVDFRDGWFGLQRSTFKQLLFDFGSKAARLHGWVPGLESAYYLLRQPAFIHRRRALKRMLRQEYGIEAPVQFLDHHLCHATSAYYSSGYGEQATVLTLDGGGDGLSATAYTAEGGRLQRVAAVPSFASLGNFYSYITQYCGFKGGRHEGKITGLAAHGRPLYVDELDSLLTYRDGQFVNTGNVFFNSALERLAEVLPPGADRADLAASVQEHAEHLATSFAEHWIRRTGNRDVALAGGVAANVKINQRIHELPEVERCFVHPGMTDVGIAVGATLAAYYGQDPAPSLDTRCMETVFLGPEFSDAQIAGVLEGAGVEYSRPVYLEGEIARLLAAGSVVARFAGRMEYGPRALGNRSILYRPDDPSVNDWLNTALKRTEFMPFAPSTLESEVEKCYEGIRGAERTSRFMTMTFNCTSWMKETCPGVVHIDGTARPQVVREADNPSYHRIISEYEALTGLPSIVNTSFNLHEEPIVCSPEDAVRAFEIGHLDYLAIGPFLAKNPRGGAREHVGREEVALG